MGQSGIDVEVMKILTEYTAEVGNAINKAGTKLTKQALKELAEVSPKRKKYPKGLSPTYSKGWRLKKFGEHGRFRVVIHNEPRYMLTTFLEQGFTHMPDKTLIADKPYMPHIKPIQDKLNRDFEAAVEKILKET